MKQFYQIAGTTKQTHLAARQRRLATADQWLMMGAVLATERGKHPAMSLKKLYHRLKPDFVGRDAFVDFGMENGFEPVLTFKKPRLTRSSDLNAHPNLLHDLKICDINQVWVSDITYFKIKGKWHYISLIEDLYSRKVLGFRASANLFAQANLDALQMALDNRGIPKYGFNLRHHSDRGSQYRSDEYTKKLLDRQIQISMGRSCFDNLYMESANGIIKNEYLVHRKIDTLDDLKSHLHNDIKLYNAERPHGSLNLMTPIEFESYISNIPLCQRTLLPVFTSKFRKNFLFVVKPDSQQLKFHFPGF
jgi:putative transposase